jgi:two-component system response regulator
LSGLEAFSALFETKFAIMRTIDAIAKPMVILLADDSDDDRMMTRDALRESLVLSDLREVEDGEQLMSYLRRQGAYREEGSSPRPCVILLDLNMPRKSGQEALEEIKSDPFLRRIPVVVLTTSADEHDILRSYNLGVSSFITKPVTFAGFVEVMKGFSKYWIEIVATPTLEDDH